MATSRTRSRTRATVIPGSYSTYNASGVEIAGPILGASGVGSYETCADSTQPYPYTTDEALSLTSWRSFPLRLYGREAVPFSTNYWEYDGWNPATRSLYVYCPTGQVINWPFWVTKAIANLNPSKPYVDLPLFLFELKDFPRMLRELGEILRRGIRLRDVPSHHLAWSFGWAPLISDLMSLLDLQKAIEDRKAYLKALEAGSRQRRTLFKGEISRVTTPDGYTIASGGPTPTLRADVLLTENLKVWFTANAKLVSELPGADLEPNLARNLALGLNLSANSLWNAIPWSWLIDYFANIGDFLDANRGYVPFKVTRMCVMVTSNVESTLTRIRYDAGVSSVGHRLTTMSKSRHVVANPVPWITYDPFLSGGQMAILGSLLTARSLKGIA